MASKIIIAPDSMIFLLVLWQASCSNIMLSFMSTRNTNRIQSQGVYQLKRMSGYFTLPFSVEGIHYDLLLDSGSSDFVIKGQNTAGNPFNKLMCPQCMRNLKYLPDDVIPRISYWDGSARGYLLYATVCFDRFKFDQHILVAFDISETVNFKRISGILGLGFPQSAVNKNPGFVQVLKNQGKIAVRLYGVVLNLLYNNRSYISLGRISRQLMAPNSKIFYYNIINNTKKNRLQYFEISLSSVLIGDTVLKVGQAIFDTGSTCIQIPIKFIHDVMLEFNRGSNVCYFKRDLITNSTFQFMVCYVRNFNQLPVLVFNIGQERYELSKQYYISSCQKRQENVYVCLMCIETAEDQQFLVGANFCQKYYTIFDQERRRLGIVRSSQVISLGDLLFSSRL